VAQTAGSRARWALPVLLVLGVLLAAAGTAGAGALHATAGEAVEELGLGVSAGYDGRGAPGGWVPVEVVLQPVRAVAGTLELSVRTDGGRMTQVRDVEATAGSRKVFRSLLPAGTIGARLLEDGRDPVAVRAQVRPVTGSWLVGVLGTLPQGLPVLRSTPTGASGTWVAVDPAWVDLSPWALETLSALVVDRETLDALSERGRSHLAVATAGGLDLVVAVDAGASDLADLPWQPILGASGSTTQVGEGAATQVVALDPAPGTWTLSAADLDGTGDAVVAAAVPAGAGRVVAVGARPGDGGLGSSEVLWSVAAPPGPSSVQDAGWRVDRSPWQLGRLLQPEGGAGAPSLPWLAAFMAVYVLVVGPVNGAVLARLRRRELAWVTVPIVTVVFTASAFVGAVRDQPESGLSGRLAYWVDGVGTEVVVAGARSATPGEHQIALEGDGWTVRTLVESEQGATVTTGDGVTVDVELAALQLGGVSARRALAAPAPLQVEAVQTSEGVTATITNVGSVPVEAVHLRAASLARRVGDLSPGASQQVSLDAAQLPVSSVGGDPFAGMAQQSLPASMEAVLRGDLADGGPGLVWAVGVTREAPAGLTIDGRAPYEAGSTVAVAARLEGSPGDVHPLAVERELISFGQDVHRYAPTIVEGGGEAFLRFRLPPGAAPQALHNELERGGVAGPRLQLSVWDAADRRRVALDDAFGPDGDRGDPAALVGPFGEVWVRASGELFPFEFSGRSISGRSP
jgi:hypothetical protein